MLEGIHFSETLYNFEKVGAKSPDNEGGTQSLPIPSLSADPAISVSGSRVSTVVAHTVLLTCFIITSGVFQ